MLICIGGLPGVGKTTVARAVAGLLPAAHLRIDAFETALLRQGLLQGDVGGHGYGLALAATDTCLAAGTDVVVDAVFPVAASRTPFTGLAQRHATALHWVRLVCGDPAEHRQRVEQRASDLDGLVVPSWADVVGRETDEWAEPHAVVDTAGDDPVAAVLAEITTG